MLQILQIFRGLAALAVCAFHASLVFTDRRFGSECIFPEYTSNGYLGVDFFFALSGFIILLVHHQDIGKGSSLPTYLVKRFIRIYPLYWLVTSVVLIGSFLAGGKTRAEGSVGDWASIFTIDHFTDIEPPVGAGWTLYHEILFYAVFLVVLWRVSVGLLLSAAWLGAVLIGAIYFPHATYSAFVQTILAPVNVAFVGGIGAYFLYRRLGRSSATGAAVTGVGVIALALLFGDQATLLFKCVLAAGFMFLLGGASAMERNGVRFNVPALAHLGNASFSLYLTHENVQSTVLKIFGKSEVLGRLDPGVKYSIVMFASVAVALVIYPLIEKPMIDFLRRRLRARNLA